MEDLVKLTKANLSAALSSKGSLSTKQFNVLGYKKPFKGWKRQLIGTMFSQQQIDKFIGLKNAHLKNRKQKTSRKSTVVIPKQKVGVYYSPKWKAKRKKIKERDNYRCVSCGNGRWDGRELVVHHLVYERDKEVWDVPDWYLVTLCDECHRKEHSKILTPPPKVY
jgi:5-methylcytosine-specific restriction endonuclease McrA